jgi:hypothetical protein
MFLKKGDVVALTENDMNSYRAKVTHLVTVDETTTNNAETGCALGVWSRNKPGMSKDKKSKGLAHLSVLLCRSGGSLVSKPKSIPSSAVLHIGDSIKLTPTSHDVSAIGGSNRIKLIHQVETMDYGTETEGSTTCGIAVWTIANDMGEKDTKTDEPVSCLLCVIDEKWPT